MQDYDLLNPGIDQVSQTMRKNVAHCISNLQGVVELGATPDADLSLFLADAATKTPGYTPAALPATQVIVATGASLPVKNSSGTVTVNGVATVAANAVTGIALPATNAIAAQAGSVTVQNSAGVQDSAATLTVAGGVITNAKLSANKTIVTSGAKVNAVSVTGTGNFATITVANGVITAIVLSAS